MHTGKIIRFYSFEAQQQIYKADKDTVIKPLEVKLESGDALFSELPEHYTIICIEEDQQIKVDTDGTKTANPFYLNNKPVNNQLEETAESGKTMFRLQQLFERLRDSDE